MQDIKIKIKFGLSLFDYARELLDTAAERMDVFHDSEDYVEAVSDGVRAFNYPVLRVISDDDKYSCDPTVSMTPETIEILYSEAMCRQKECDEFVRVYGDSSYKEERRLASKLKTLTKETLQANGFDLAY